MQFGGLLSFGEIKGLITEKGKIQKKSILCYI